MNPEEGGCLAAPLSEPKKALLFALEQQGLLYLMRVVPTMIRGAGAKRAGFTPRILSCSDFEAGTCLHKTGASDRAWRRSTTSDLIHFDVGKFFHYCPFLLTRDFRAEPACIKNE